VPFGRLAPGACSVTWVETVRHSEDLAKISAVSLKLGCDVCSGVKLHAQPSCGLATTRFSRNGVRVRVKLKFSNR